MRRRGQKKGWLRSESGSWLLTYRLYDVAGDSRRETSTIGPSEGRGRLTQKQAETVAGKLDERPATGGKLIVMRRAV